MTKNNILWLMQLVAAGGDAVFDKNQFTVHHNGLCYTTWGGEVDTCRVNCEVEIPPKGYLTLEAEGDNFPGTRAELHKKLVQLRENVDKMARAAEDSDQ